jgi:hypothetical protein
MDFRSFLFICTSYRATFLNRSDKTWHHLCLQILSPFPPSSALPKTYFPRRMTIQTCQPTQLRACLRRQHAFTWDRLLEDSPRVSSSLPDRVCVHRRIVTYSGHFLLRYSHGTFFCNVLNTLRRLRPLTCVCSYVSQPLCGYIFQTFPSSLLQHIPSHTSALSATPTSAHACTVTIMKFLSLYQKITPYIRFRDW